MPAAEPLPGRELAAFVAAVEAGSVQAAADVLALTQSAATKRLLKLECRLGTRLLERGRFGVRPTPAGERLYPYAGEALAALCRAEEAVAGASGAPPLLLAASRTIGGFLLPAWLARFRGDEPWMRVQVEVVNSAGVLRAVRDGHADLGFVEDADGGDRGLVSLTLGRDEIVAVVAIRHAWATRRQVAASSLLAEQFVARERGSGTRDVVRAALIAKGIALEPALEADSIESIKRAVRVGGFSLLSRLAVQSEVESRTLHALPVSGVDLTRDLRVVRRAHGRHSGAAARLWAWLAHEVAASSGRGQPPTLIARDADRSPPIGPRRHALELTGDAQQPGLVAVGANELDPDGKSVGALVQRERDRRLTGDVEGRRVRRHLTDQ
jgi:DNA-binding transcriptional LysR family regulator